MTKDSVFPDLSPNIAADLARIADALDRLTPAPRILADLEAADAYVWHTNPDHLDPVAKVSRVDLDLLKGIDQVRDQLFENTLHFAKGLPANNALLWGARGMGKSSLVKAVHAAINQKIKPAMVLIEIHREDISSLPRLLKHLGSSKRQFLLFCDDLSFDETDVSYKSLKAVLEGGIEGRPGNVILYATSNRRHLLPRNMMENESSTAINPAEAVEEKVSLSDRFGLWLGFHSCSQDDYLSMIEGYIACYKLGVTLDDIRHQALEWSITRGARSGRVASQYIQDLAGRLGKSLTLP